MKRNTTIVLGALALVALLGLGVASAHGGFGKAQDGAAHFQRAGHGPGAGPHHMRTVQDVCSPDITVGECHELMKGHFREKCLERHDEAFCAERQAEHEARMADGAPRESAPESPYRTPAEDEPPA